MPRLCPVFLAAATVLLAPISVAHAKPGKTHKKDKPKVEVVFCLDTTGSMSGLIEGAKQKIWSMCNQIAAGKPTPDLKVGLVAYRDRGDDYITKVFDLTDDLDSVLCKLNGFQAAGGGDEPESVNEALDVAVRKIQWSDGDDTLKIIFLVGDAPPHMDYANDIPYPVTCKKACEKDIIINTIQCGTIHCTTPIWKEIARKAEGKYVQIQQDGGVVAIATPYDQRLAEINDELAQRTVVWGDDSTRSANNAKLGQQCVPFVSSAPAATGSYVSEEFMAHRQAAPGVSMSTAADRAGCSAKTGRVASYDLIDGIKEGRVKLEDVKTEQLPQELRKLSLSERKAYLAKVEKERTALHLEALELDKKRCDYLQKKLAEDKNHAGFDGQVLDMLRDQAQKYDIAY